MVVVVVDFDENGVPKGDACLALAGATGFISEGVWENNPRGRASPSASWMAKKPGGWEHGCNIGVSHRNMVTLEMRQSGTTFR